MDSLEDPCFAAFIEQIQVVRVDILYGVTQRVVIRLIYP
jgi:hypothetical protein